MSLVSREQKCSFESPILSWLSCNNGRDGSRWYERGDTPLVVAHGTTTPAPNDTGTVIFNRFISRGLASSLLMNMLNLMDFLNILVTDRCTNTHIRIYSVEKRILLPTFPDMCESMHYPVTHRVCSKHQIFLIIGAKVCNNLTLVSTTQVVFQFG